MMVKRHPLTDRSGSPSGQSAESRALNNRKRECAKIAREWLQTDPIYLDTETTGLGSEDEVVEIGIVDSDGTPLMNQLVKPTRPIPKEASDIHGITNDDVADKPRWNTIHDRFVEIIQNRTIIIYNQQYDVARLKTTIRAHDHTLPDFKTAYCAMKLYARWYGAWSDYHHSYTWQKLSVAASEFDLSFGGNQHRAFDDANVTRQVIESMAGQSP